MSFMECDQGSQRTNNSFGLDLLKPEICEEIAQHVTGGRQTEAALNLAETSPTQCLAVLAALSFRLRIDAGMGNTVRWAEVFKDQVRELELDWCPGVHPEPHLISLLSAPSLRRAEMADHPAFLRAIVLSSTVQDLTINICDDTSNGLLFMVLPSLHISRLSLRCARKSLTCNFLDETLFNKDFNILAATCPHLSALEIDCKCSGRDTPPIWNIFPLMKSLREVRLDSKEASGEEILKLRALEIVRIQGERAQELAVRVGSSVTELSDRSLLNTRQIIALGTCYRLTVLNIHIIPGAERDLYQTFCSLPLLREAKLRWGQTMDSSYEPQAGLLLKVVRELPELTHLALTEVRLSCEELAAIQRHIGSRLNEFQTMISGQDEPSADRLNALLHVAIEHNPSLRVFDISVSDTWADDSGHPTPNNENWMNALQGSRIRFLIEKLKRRAPFLDLDPLERFTEMLILS